MSLVAKSIDTFAVELDLTGHVLKRGMPSCDQYTHIYGLRHLMSMTSCSSASLCNQTSESAAVLGH